MFFNQAILELRHKTSSLKGDIDNIKREYKIPKTIKTASDGSQTEEYPEKYIFLSHSHADKNLILGFQSLLKEKNIKLYIDWQDNDMPKVTNELTAMMIKRRIRNSSSVWVFATNNALMSVWVPWEIGISDGYDPNKIFIIPVGVENREYKGNEYLKIYKSIQMHGDELKIFDQYSQILENVKSLI